jgi:hypothetical protein
MKHKVKCAVCGRADVVEIDDKTREIKSEWGYLQTENLPNIGNAQNVLKMRVHNGEA